MNIKRILGKRRVKTIGQGSYIFCEWDSVQKEDRQFQEVFAKLETAMINKCNTEWAPRTMGYLTPAAGQYGRTSILPALFDPNPLTYGGVAFGGTRFLSPLTTWPVPPAYWRQAFSHTGHQTLIQGNRTGETMPEDWKVGWLGLAFPNKNQHITEIRFQIGDRKYGRINIEEMNIYNKPAIIFEEPFIIDEETSFELYGYFEGPIPESPFSPVEEVGGENHYLAYQRIVMLGEACYKVVDRALGATGAAI